MQSCKVPDETDAINAVSVFGIEAGSLAEDIPPEVGRSVLDVDEPAGDAVIVED